MQLFAYIWAACYHLRKGDCYHSQVSQYMPGWTETHDVSSALLEVCILTMHQDSMMQMQLQSCSAIDVESDTCTCQHDMLHMLLQPCTALNMAVMPVPANMDGFTPEAVQET